MYFLGCVCFEFLVPFSSFYLAVAVVILWPGLAVTHLIQTPRQQSRVGLQWGPVRDRRGSGRIGSDKRGSAEWSS